ncbi:hypothetical protein HHUSO_G20613, partial [Huso huso]
AQEQNGLLLMALKLKHKLTNDAVLDIMRVLKVISGKTLPPTLYMFQKQFENITGVIEIHHVCKLCDSYIGTECSGKCCFCAEEWNENESIKNGNFFFYLPMTEQLKSLLLDPNIASGVLSCKGRFSDNTMHDIIDGAKYRTSYSTVPDSCNVISLSFSCDGIPVFNSSSFSVWPVLCVIIEIPPKERFSHILLASLWFGSKKPDMTVFLQPFVDECKNLSTEGMSWTDQSTGKKIFSNVLTTAAICDSVARPMLQNMVQYNGLYGCGFCQDSGKVVSKGKGNARVYPYNRDSYVRTTAETLENAKHALKEGKPVNGVKGPSLLSVIPSFDLIDNFVPDYMHCVLLGVTRQMAKLWFDTQYHNEKFYLGSMVCMIDRILLSIKPPCNISRAPRSVTIRKYWKAHEWQAWLLFYSVPILKDLLPEKYYVHWCLLVEGIAILLGESIDSEKLAHCERIFRCFVQSMEELYGLQHVSYNVHLTLHLAKSVLDWGPLWAHSAFSYESYNSCLLDYVKGTQAVPQQMCLKFLIEKSLPILGNRAMMEAPAKLLFSSLI